MKSLMGILLVIVLLAGTALAASPDGEILRSLNLTDEQMNGLEDLLLEYNQKQIQIAGQLAAKTMELEREFLRADRLATEQKATAGANRADKLIRESTQLYGKAFKTRVEYMLKAKDVLTLEQKVMLVASLDFDMGSVDDLEHYEELDWLNVGLGLTYDQVERILDLRTDRKIAELRLSLKIDKRVLDLEQHLLSGKYDPEEVNEIITEITNLATEQLDNLTEHFLRTKDILTMEQKRQVMHMLMMH